MAWYNQEEHATVYQDQESDSLNWKNIARMAGQGVTFGWSDEILAALRAKIGDEDYETLVKSERDAMDKFKKEHPGIAYGTEIVSSFFVPGAAARLGVRGGVAGAKGLAKLAGAGAAESALYSAGVAEEGDRAGAATTGAVAGAVLGPAISKSGGAAAKYIGRRFGPGGARAQGAHVAEKKVLRALDEDTGSAESVLGPASSKTYRDRLGRTRATRVEPDLGIAPRAGQDMDMIADVEGGNIRKLAMGATTEDPGVYGRADTVLSARIGKEFDDLVDNASEQLRVTHRATQMADEAAVRVSQAADPIYKQAYGMRHLPMDNFRAFFNNDKLRKAYNDLKGDMDIMATTEPDAEGVIRMVDWKDFIKGESVSTQLLHKLKIELDDMAQWGSRDPEVRVKAVRSLIKAINREAGALNPDYAKANKIFSVGPQMKEAVANGADAIKNLKPEQIRKAYDKMSTFEKRAYRAGMLEEVVRPMSANKDKSFAGYLDRNTGVRDRLRSVFRDEADWNTFMGEVQKKLHYRKTKKDILSTSRTAERTAAKESLRGTASKVGGAAIEATKLNFGTMAAQLVGMMDNKYVAQEVGQLLFTGNPGQTGAAIRRLLEKRRDLSGQDRIALGDLIKKLKIATTVEPQRQMVGAGAAVTGSLLDDPRQWGAKATSGLLPPIF